MLTGTYAEYVSDTRGHHGYITVHQHLFIIQSALCSQTSTVIMKMTSPQDKELYQAL